MNAWVYISTTNCSNVASNVKASIDETFSFGTTLNIQNVELYDGHVWFRRDFDNSQPRHNNNVIENVVILDDFLDHISWNRSVRIFEEVRNT